MNRNFLADTADEADLEGTRLRGGTEGVAVVAPPPPPEVEGKCNSRLVPSPKMGNLTFTPIFVSTFSSAGEDLISNYYYSA